MYYFQLSRWTLLVAGILYGLQRQRVLAVKEAVIRAEEEKMQILRNVQLEEEKKAAALESARTFAGIFAPKSYKATVTFEEVEEVEDNDEDCDP